MEVGIDTNYSEEDITLVPIGDGTFLTRKELIDIKLERQKDKFNTYASHKSVSQELLNTSIIQGQIGLIIGLFVLKASATTAEGKILNAFEIALLVLIAVSLLIRFTMFVLIIIMLRTSRTQVSKKVTTCTVTEINNTVMSLSGLTLILDIAITTIAVQSNKVTG